MHRFTAWIALAVGAALPSVADGQFAPKSPAPESHSPAAPTAPATIPASGVPTSARPANSGDLAWPVAPATYSDPTPRPRVAETELDPKSGGAGSAHHLTSNAPGGEGKPLARPGGVTHGREITGLPSVWGTLGSLILVIAIFCGAMWMLRRASPQTVRTLPREALEVLGRSPLAGKQQVHLVRCGNKLLLLAIAPGEVKTLTEITDPVEVDRLAGLCVQNSSSSATASFRQVFQQFAGDRTARGFLGQSHRSSAELAAGVADHAATEDDDV